MVVLWCRGLSTRNESFLIITVMGSNHSHISFFPSGRVQLGHESGRKERHAFATRLSRTARNPFPWMSETIDLGKEKNFFESRVKVGARSI